ncbi:unnamed protein product [Diamesa tonsa]
MSYTLQEELISFEELVPMETGSPVIDNMNNVSVNTDDLDVDTLMNDNLNFSTERLDDESIPRYYETAAETLKREMNFVESIPDLQDIPCYYGTPAETMMAAAIPDPFFYGTTAETMMAAEIPDPFFYGTTAEIPNPIWYCTPGDTFLPGTNIPEFISFEPYNKDVNWEVDENNLVEATNHEMISFEEPYVKEETSEIVEHNTTNEIPLYFYNFNNKTLKNNENIIIETMEDAPADIPVVKINPFYCQECDKSFYKSGPYIQHRNVHHTDEESQNKCNICGKRFATEEALQIHATKHEDTARTHICQICPKAYVHKVDLKRHMTASHEPQSSKPYQCEECGKGFVRNDHFKKHKESHIRKKILQDKKKLQLVQKRK